jgi:hypothetical protein
MDIANQTQKLLTKMGMPKSSAKAASVSAIRNRGTVSRVGTKVQKQGCGGCSRKNARRR